MLASRALYGRQPLLHRALCMLQGRRAADHTQHVRALRCKPTDACGCKYGARCVGHTVSCGEANLLVDDRGGAEVQRDLTRKQRVDVRALMV